MVTGTPKRLLPNDIELLKKLQKRHLLKMVRSILLFGLFLSLFLLSYHNIIFYKQPIVHTALLLRGTASAPFFTIELQHRVIMIPRFYFSLYYWLLLGFGGAYLALFPFCSLLVTLFAIHSPPRVFSGWNTFFLALSLLAGMAVSLTVTLVLIYFHSIHLVLFDTIVGYFFCMTLITVIIMSLIRRSPPVPPFRQTIQQILIGILLAVFLYCTTGQLLQIPFVVAGTQLWHSGILFLFLWPTYLFYEESTRSWRDKRHVGREITRGEDVVITFTTMNVGKSILVWLTGYLFKLLFLFSFFVIFFLFPSVTSLHIFWPTLLILILILEGCCSYLYKKGRAAIAGATASALLMAYTLVALSSFTR